MLVQIYEIQTPVEAQLMLDLGVDHIGSVLLSERTWRDEAILQTVRLVQAGGRKSSLIPLFQDVDLISRAIEFYRPDIIHFCEALGTQWAGESTILTTLARQKEIRQRFPDLAIMRSVPIVVSGSGSRLPSLEVAARFEPYSDWFLTDTVLMNHGQHASEKDQPVAGYVGITGKTCDWQVARELVARSRIPVILAGGIGPLNVTDGITAVEPAGVDSCTQTNATDDQGRPIRFKKDVEKVRKLVQLARAAHVKITSGPRSSASRGSVA
ncbi:MAG: hypothetical protein M0036_26875 [Desulfobacteraceae bacterium]|nr:hypothetical protein [Desulfobacteraceae bacterium]